MLERVKRAIDSVLNSSPEHEVTGAVALNTEFEAMDKEQFDALSGEVKGLTEAVGGLDEKIATAVANAMKPLVDAQEAIATAAKDKADADKLALANKVVEAGLLTEEVAKAADIAVLNALIEKHEAAASAPAFRVSNAFRAKGDNADLAKLPD